MNNCSALFVDFSSKKGGGFGGMFGMLKGLVGSKSLTRDDMESVLEKMKDHLIGTTSQLFLSFSLSHRLDFLLHFTSASSPNHSSSFSDPTAKNVAADIASQLCDSVAKKLEGKVMGTFTSRFTYPQGSPTFLNVPFGGRISNNERDSTGLGAGKSNVITLMLH